jgi:hypothetical protein
MIKGRKKKTTTINNDNDEILFSLNTRDLETPTGYKYARTFRLGVETPRSYRFHCCVMMTSFRR